MTKKDGRIGVLRCVVDGTLVVSVIVVVVGCVVDGTLVVKRSVVVVGSVVQGSCGQCVNGCRCWQQCQCDLVGFGRGGGSVVRYIG